MEENAPLTARARLVSQGVEDPPHVDLAGPPPGLAGGIRGLRIFHWASVRSDGYFLVENTGTERPHPSKGA